MRRRLVPFLLVLLGFVLWFTPLYPVGALLALTAVFLIRRDGPIVTRHGQPRR